MNLDVSRREFLVASGSALAAGLFTHGLNAGQPAEAYPIGCYTRPFADHDYRVALDAIAEAGYKYCGLMTAKSWTTAPAKSTTAKARPSTTVSVDSTAEEVAQIAADVKQRGLQALSLYGGGFPVEKSIEAGVAGLRRLIDHCALIDARNLMLGGTGNDKLYDAYFKVVAECCEYAAGKGIGLSIKPHGGRNASGADCRKAIEKVGHRNFKVWYDPGNIFFYSDGKLDPVDDAGSVDGLVVGMSVKDFKLPKEVMVTPGTGLVNFAKVLAKLKAGGFTRGALIVECLDRGELKATIEEARKARRFLQDLTGSGA